MISTSLSCNTDTLLSHSSCNDNNSNDPALSYTLCNKSLLLFLKCILLIIFSYIYLFILNRWLDFYILLYFKKKRRLHVTTAKLQNLCMLTSVILLCFFELLNFESKGKLSLFHRLNRLIEYFWAVSQKEKKGGNFSLFYSKLNPRSEFFSSRLTYFWL